MTRVCTICKFPKALELFPKHKLSKDGHIRHCSGCETERQHLKYLKKHRKTETKLWKHDISALHTHAVSHGGTCLSVEYFDADTKYQWRCHLGHEWMASLPTTKDRWCPLCAKELRKATKLKKYGDPNFNNREKSRQTCMERYGSYSNMGNREIALKNAKNRTHSYIQYHWSSNEELVCQGLWERNVVTYLNEGKVEFDWQVAFKLSDGRTYIIDFFNKNTNTYVEIKGWWRDDAREKYDLFRSDYPSLNVEVWDKAMMKKLNIRMRK